MRPRDQRRMVELVRQQRACLEELREDFEGLYAEQVQRAAWRVWDVENFLERDLREGRRRPNRIAGRAFDRLDEILAPKIGAFAHSPPVALRLPAAYWRAGPPEPAPSISIVTPSYRHGRYIERTIFSVISQQYPRLEYVVQDGGSSDGTIDVLRRHEPALAAWDSSPDSGMADALNRGFARTSGEIMGYLNSDDLLLPGSLAHVARYFAAHPEVDIVYGDRILIDERDRQVGMWVLPAHSDEALIWLNYVPQETMFWRRRIWDAAGGQFDTSFSFAVDWDLLLRFREQGATFAHVPRFLGAFRVHARQKTQREGKLGDMESDRLRARLHGRPVPTAEANTRVTAHRRRHVRAHLRRRLLDRLPLARREVQTAPASAERAKPGAAD